MAAPQLAFDPARHAYTLGDEPLISVTQMLEKMGLSGCPFWTPEARARGTAVHKIALLIGKRLQGRTAEEIVTNSLWDPARTAPVLVPYGMACAKWYAKTGLTPELVETPVHSVTLKLAGTLDLCGLLPSGERMLVDFKSGDPEAAADLQTALYVFLLRECLGIEVKFRTVVWLQKDGEFKQFPPRPVGGPDLMTAISAVNVYHWRVKHRRLSV